jgi:DNA (cytosine-5)-methyltransferase 1
MSAYYNEIDPFAAAWLRNLIAAGHIAPGDVDERSIREVSGDDLRGYRQCHFFAGIGVWSYALRGAGWADDAPVWTGSCPCQPFSAAGKRKGVADDRHLWPEFFRLIRECRPAIVLGEQVAGKAGYGWWDVVSADLETEDYASAAADLAAASAGAPHIRQRLLWMAYRNGGAGGQGCAEFRGCGDRSNAHERRGPRSGGEPVGLAYGTSAGREWRRSSQAGEWSVEARQQPERFCDAVELAYGCGARLEIVSQQSARRERQAAERSGEAERLGDAEDHHGRLPDGRQRGAMSQPIGASEAGGDQWAGPTNGFWRDADWIRCTDARWRPVEPGAFPLASGIAGRVGRLRAYGNAMCAPLVVAFIQAAREALEDVRAA